LQLPLVVQADPNKPPEMFDVPIEVAPPVYIHHPQYPELSSLNMQWYPIPAVCALDMTLGGITYTAVPFNGE
jgi:nitric-oxide synthase